MDTPLKSWEKFKDLRKKRSLTLEQLSEQTGLAASTLGKYENEECKEYSSFCIITLAKFYGVTSDYLLGLTEQENHPNTDLLNLHLSDEMIALLRSGEINNALLCEIATHKDFRNLLMDIDIYVDRIASMQIDNLNAVLATIHPGADSFPTPNYGQGSVPPNVRRRAHPGGQVFYPHDPCGH